MSEPQPPHDPLDLFHRHLDRCEQCRTQPFNLCGEGTLLLYLTVQAIESSMLDLSPLHSAVAGQ